MKNSDKITNLGNDQLLLLYRENGNPDYFGELFRRYIPLLYGLCLKYLGKEEDAQDAVMDLFESLSENVRRYDIHNFHTWLYSVAKNHCLQRLRHEKQTVFINIDQSVMENSNFFTLIDKEQQSDDEKSALNFCMKALNEEQHASIHYFYFEEKSYADIASLTGYPLEKVKSYIQNGKRNLKNCIVKFLRDVHQ